MPRTSGLQAPIMELAGKWPHFEHWRKKPLIQIGHSGEVFATRFDPTGQIIASGSMDRSIRTKHFSYLALQLPRFIFGFTVQTCL